MTRTFDRRLRKLEARIGFAQELRRMSDEELEASIDCDIPGMVGVLSQGGEQEQALARMLEGRRVADLKTHELDHIVQVLQGGLLSSLRAAGEASA
jgi:hypothetical protein